MVETEPSATFTVIEPEIMPCKFKGELGPDNDFYIYSRNFNPTISNLARKLAALEGIEVAYCTSNGMSAITSVLLQICRASDHIVASNCLYRGTHALLSSFLPSRCGIRTTFVDAGDLEEVGMVVFVESVANPMLLVADIPGLSRIAKEKGAVLVVDNTFMPVVLSSAKLGADVVVDSLSKFISGGVNIIVGCYKD